MTVSQMLAHIVSASPDGIVVVDTFNDVVYANDRATELGIVRDRLLDDRAWRAAEQVFATGQAVDVDLSPRKLPHPGHPLVDGWKPAQPWRSGSSQCRHPMQCLSP